MPALLSEFQPARATWEHVSSALVAGLCEGQFSSQTGHLDSSLVTLLRQLAHLISTDLGCVSGFQGLSSGPEGPDLSFHWLLICTPVAILAGVKPGWDPFLAPSY